MWYFNGHTYDLSKFAKSHPGGKHLIVETNNFDITYLVQCNHNWTKEYAIKRLEPYKVSNDKYKKNKVDILWDEKLDRIHEKLTQKNIDLSDLKTPWWGWLYYCVFGAVYLFFGVKWLIDNEYSLLFGVFGWLWAGFIQHEASHNALSHNKHINYLFRYALIPWSEPEAWFRKHSVLHHQFTNTKLDPDFQGRENVFVRHHNSVTYRCGMKFQILTIALYSIVMPFFYNISYITIIQLGMISLHYWIHNSLLGCISPFIGFGVIFLFITQLNHIQESAISKKILDKPDDFVVHQIKSCINYSFDNLLISSLSIFLNYQTYHHLFPNVSHFHFLTLREDMDEVIARYNPIQTCSLVTVIKKYFQYLWKNSFDDKVGTSRRHQTRIVSDVRVI